MNIFVINFFVIRRSCPHQLSDVGEYLDNKLADIASACSQSSSGK
jgi:hypothetical protein